MDNPTQKFGALAVIDGEFQMTPEERLRYSLENPGARHSLSIPRTDKITAARIRYAFSELLAGNMDNIQQWLEEVAKQSPKVAVELMIELAQFTLPKLKSVAVQIDDPSSANARQLSFDQLQKIVSEQ